MSEAKSGSRKNPGNRSASDAAQVITSMDLSQIPDGAQGGQNAEEEEAKRAQEEQMRRDMMATVLDSGARERLSRISLVSPERSRQIEMILLRMAQSGQLRGRVSENQLIELLDQMESAGGKTTTKQSKIVFQRRKDFDDDDFDI